MFQAAPSPAGDALKALIRERVDGIVGDPATTPDVDRDRLARLLLASDYAFERLRRRPGDLAALDGAPPPPPDPDDPDFADALRRWRHVMSLRIAYRDVNGIDDIEATLRETSALADRCLSLALAVAEREVRARHGTLRDADGREQRMVVFALGKLGGGELNFSSDVDLVFAYPGGGQSDGERTLDGDGYFARVGQRFIQLLDAPTTEGFVYRVDMRLRPFGQAGRLALSFNAMEQYFQREGRDWERYAWIKARPVAGDIDAGEDFLRTLRPFVYRRYLDYTAFEGLREMKGLIAAEVKRRDLAQHLKLGAGGIREIEFIVQLLQMIRGGREPELRARGLLPALAALERLGHLAPDAASRLREAYGFLRRVENRLQMLREAQVHEPPEDAPSRLRIARGLGYDGWDALARAIAQHRAAVSAEFERVFDTPRSPPPEVAALADYWSHVGEPDAADRLADAGFADARAIDAAMRDFARSPAVLARSAKSRARLDRVVPALLAAAARTAQPREAVERVIRLLHGILRRSSYLALLAEQPAALERVVEVMAASAFLAERVGAHPILLDDLLDRRSEEAAPDPAALESDLDRHLAGVDRGDTEAVLHALNEFKQSQLFRLGLAHVFRRQPAVDTARLLAWLAECTLRRLLPIALAEVTHAHGRLPGADADGSIAAIAYGSFGGRELGFGSDLDLVFLYDGALIDAESDGARALDAARWYARVVQRATTLLGTLTPAGRLYAVDLRLRPDGSRGLLVSTLDSYADYQRERAWTWEHQALVRARCVAGSTRLGEHFAAVRREVLCRARDVDALRRDVAAMRTRMRAELDRSRGDRFDVKQGVGGLVDLEFLLQAAVLEGARAHPALIDAPDTPALLDAACGAGLLDDDSCSALRFAHAHLLERGLSCTLDARPRVIAVDDDTARAREAVLRVWRARLGDDPRGA